MQLVFDKLAYVDRLTASGLAEPQARAHAEALEVALREEVATKADINALSATTRADIAALRAATTADIAALRSATEADIAALRSDTKADNDALRAELKIVARDLKVWTGSLAAGAVVALAALRFFA